MISRGQPDKANYKIRPPIPRETQKNLRTFSEPFDLLTLVAASMGALARGVPFEPPDTAVRRSFPARRRQQLRVEETGGVKEDSY